MRIDLIIGAVAAVIVILGVLYIVYKKVPKKLKVDQFVDDWKQLQGYCKDKATWPEAVQAADKLLDKALKKRRFKGKRMGERMVSAQRMITDNDRLWFAHNLAKKLITDPALKLKEADVKTALVGFRQALKDLGALQVPETPEQTDEGKK